MKRTVFDVVRRGIDNVLANWQVLLLRFAITIVSLIIMVGGIVAMCMPLFLSLGLGTLQHESPDVVLQNLFQALAAKWLMLVWIFIAASVLLILLVAIYSFTLAGCLRIYVKGDRQAGPYPTGDRSRFAAFSMEEFWTGAKERWWELFWLYNIVWGVIGLLVLVPAIPFMIVMLVSMAKHAEAGIACGGCLALGVMVFLGIFLAIGGGVYSVKASVVCIERGLGAREALRAAWQEIKGDLGRHIAVAGLVLAVGIIVGMVFGGVSSVFSILSTTQGRSSDVPLALAFLPIRLGISFVQQVVSEIIGMWMVASFVALTPESK